MPSLVLPPLHKRQAEIADHPAKFKVAIIGRQWGKSYFARIEAVKKAVTQGKTVWWVAPTYKTALPHWRALKRMLQDAPFLISKNEQQWYMEFSSGGSISIKSADRPDTLRGESLDFIIIDEAAFIPEYVWTNVLLGSMGAREGAQALFISTPNGKNWLYKLYCMGQEDHPTYDPNWKSWRFPSNTSPYFQKDLFNAAKKTLTKAAFEREFLASFESSDSTVFTNLDDWCVLKPRFATEDDYIIMGVDFGRKNDYTVANIFDRNTGHQLAIERFQEPSLETQVTILKKLVQRWDPQRMNMEENSFGVAVIQRLKEETKDMRVSIRPIYMTNPRKLDLIDNYIVNLEQGRTLLLAPDTTEGSAQYEEMTSYNVKTTASGLSVTYNAASGFHDDCIMSAALANKDIRRKKYKAVNRIENFIYS